MRAILFAAIASGVAPVAFMADIVDTMLVKVKGNSNGLVRINASDFDDTIHTLDEKATAEQSPGSTGFETNLAPGVIVPPAPSAPTFAATGPATQAAGVAPTVPDAGQLLVLASGKKFIVVTQEGGASVPVKGMTGIDEKGYATQELAFEAIRAAAVIRNDTGVTILGPEATPTV